MRRFLTAIAALILAAASAFAQVDTLMLVEINSIEVPGNITQIYTESIRDNVKEIFICTDDHIYCYDSQTNELIWSRGELIHPTDLLFEDINNDGFTDIAFRDSLNIFLYDVINQDNIWTSPVLDSTYKCYTIGDRNDDGWSDVVIASKEPFTRPQIEGNLDTVWVDIYDGPGFSENPGFQILMQNLAYSIWRLIETPDRIFIEKLSGSEGLQNTIILYSDYYYGRFEGGDYSTQAFSGNAWLINGVTFEYSYIAGACSLLYHENYNRNDSSLIISLCDSYTISGSAWIVIHTCDKYIKTISADSIIDNCNLWHDIYIDYSLNRLIDWAGYSVADFNSESPGNEILFADDNRISLYSFTTLDTIWITELETEIEFLEFAISCQYLYEHRQIICKIIEPALEYILFTGYNGLLTARIINVDNEISLVTDLNADGNDEILSIDGNTLRIYNLEYYVDIDQPATVPYQTFIQPNYPNPFNAATTIEYGLSQPGQVIIEIYDLLGRRVETLVDETKSAGLYQATWQAEDMPSGVYFYKIETRDYTKTRKMMLLK